MRATLRCIRGHAHPENLPQATPHIGVVPFRKCLHLLWPYTPQPEVRSGGASHQEENPNCVKIINQGDFLEHRSLFPALLQDIADVPQMTNRHSQNFQPLLGVGNSRSPRTLTSNCTLKIAPAKLHRTVALDPHTGPPLWTPTLDPHSGPSLWPLWTFTLDPHTGPSHWTLTLDLHSGPSHWTLTLDFTLDFHPHSSRNLEPSLWTFTLDLTLDFFFGLSLWTLTLDPPHTVLAAGLVFLPNLTSKIAACPFLLSSDSHEWRTCSEESILAWTDRSLYLLE